eukprot:372771_1
MDIIGLKLENPPVKDNAYVPVLTVRVGDSPGHRPNDTIVNRTQSDSGDYFIPLSYAVRERLFKEDGGCFAEVCFAANKKDVKAGKPYFDCYQGPKHTLEYPDGLREKDDNVPKY